MVSKSVTVSVVAVDGTIASTASAGSSSGSNGGATVEVGAISDRGVGWSSGASSPQPATSSMEASTTSVRGSMRPSLPNLVRVATPRRIERPLNGARSRVGIRKIGVEEELMLVDPETGPPDRRRRAGRRAPGDDGRRRARGRARAVPAADRDHDRALRDPRRPRRSSCGPDAARSSDCRGRGGAAAAAAMPTPVLVDEDTSITPEATLRADPRGVRRARPHRAGVARCTSTSTSTTTSRGCGCSTASAHGCRCCSRSAPTRRTCAVGTPATPAGARRSGPAGPATAAPRRSAPQRRTTRCGGTLTEWGAALDDGMVYFDARLSREVPHCRDPGHRRLHRPRRRRACRRPGPWPGHAVAADDPATRSGAATWSAPRPGGHRGTACRPARPPRRAPARTGPRGARVAGRVRASRPRRRRRPRPGRGPCRASCSPAAAAPPASGGSSRRRVTSRRSCATWSRGPRSRAAA